MITKATQVCRGHASIFDNPYELVIYSGSTAQKVISRWRTFDDAYCAKHENFTPEEQLELDVDIMKLGIDY